MIKKHDTESTTMKDKKNWKKNIFVKASTLNLLTALVCHLLFIRSLHCEIVIKSPEANSTHYKAFVISEKHSSYSSYILEKKKKESLSSSHLKNLFKDATSDFISASLDLAKLKFQSITLKKHESDWSKNNRKLIFFSFIRLYQITKDTKYFQKAINFSSNDFDIKGVLSPPSMKIYSQIKSETKYIVWKPYKSWKQFQFILANGEVHEITPALKIALPRKTNIRLTFLSDSFHSFTRVLQSSDVLFLTPFFKPLVSGTCEAPTASVTLDGLTKFFFSKDCVFEKNKGQQNLSNFVPAKKAPEPWISEDFKKKAKKQLKNKWLWIGAGLLLGGYHLYKKSKDSSEKQFPEGAGN